ncbi:ABC transporter substrate-binding protein [Hydrocarboniclastica marina]|uniref:ABC transporter substrate-binding protein n=2 Tax=Hydrocarboniclastica marina TaxID=2259620 RepID=A0A4V1D999_9ALTE|nr:ABC transporter substrate-binding protein [Hydrocarboniclastica marina]
MAMMASGLLFSATAGALEKVRLAQNASPISGITMVANQQGFMKDHGIDLEVRSFTTGRQCLETVIGGGADIATTAEAPTTAAAMANQPIAFLARTQYSDLKTLTSADAGIDTLADLRGKRIAFTAGTGAEVYTMKLLEKAGLTKSDVQLINLRPQDMAAALASGSIDAFNIFEPHVANARRVMGDDARLLNTSGIYAETFNIVLMQDYLESNRETVLNFMRALIEAEQWIKDNREQAISVIAEAAGMPEEDLAAIFDDYIYEVVIDDRTMDILNTHAQWRLESGNHPSGATMPDFSKVVYPGVLQEIAPARVTAEGL